VKIAISGKGGTGKTTLAASLARIFSEKGHSIYAIDADPDANLGAMLGIEGSVKPLIDLKETISERVGDGEGMFKLNPQVDDVLDDHSIDLGNIKFLRMGFTKPPDTACYCPENAFLRSVMNSLVFGRDDVVIMDMGAGIEHLSRGTATGVDTMLIVAEPSIISLQTTRTIWNLAEEAGIQNIYAVGNKIRSDVEDNFIDDHLGDKLISKIQYNEELLEAALCSDSSTQPLLKEDAENIYEILKPVE